MKVEKKEVVCIRLPESTKKKVDAEAKKMYLAPSKLVSIIVQKYYEKPFNQKVETYSETFVKGHKL